MTVRTATATKTPFRIPFLHRFFVGEFIGAPIYYKPIACVRGRIAPSTEDGWYGWLLQRLFRGYQLQVTFDEHQDCQTLYPSTYIPRAGWVRVSKRLFEAKPHTVAVFCQYSQLRNTTTSVKLRLAK